MATVGSGGLLTLQLSGTGSDGYAVIDDLRILPLQFDMGEANQVVPAGYASLSNYTWYSTALGYGITATSNNVSTVDYGLASGSTAVTRSEITGTSLTFRFDLPDGTYDVSPTVGDRGPYPYTIQVSLQGTVVGTVTTAGGQNLSPSYQVTVSSGDLIVNILGVGSNQETAIQGLTIAPASGSGQDDVEHRIGPTASPGLVVAGRVPDPGSNKGAFPKGPLSVSGAHSTSAPLPHAVRMSTSVRTTLITILPTALTLTKQAAAIQSPDIGYVVESSAQGDSFRYPFDLECLAESLVSQKPKSLRRASWIRLGDN